MKILNCEITQLLNCEITRLWYLNIVSYFCSLYSLPPISLVSAMWLDSTYTMPYFQPPPKYSYSIHCTQCPSPPTNTVHFYIILYTVHHALFPPPLVYISNWPSCSLPTRDRLQRNCKNNIFMTSCLFLMAL